MVNGFLFGKLFRVGGGVGFVVRKSFCVKNNIVFGDLVCVSVIGVVRRDGVVNNFSDVFFKRVLRMGSSFVVVVPKKSFLDKHLLGVGDFLIFNLKKVSGGGYS